MIPESMIFRSYFLFFLLHFAGSAFAETNASEPLPPIHTTFSSFTQASRASGVPEEVLYSIAMNESAFGHSPWPWTLNVSGKAFYFKDRQSAHEAVQYLLKRRFKDFDIGLMQVNWRYHSQRFNNAWEALDPERNQLVAAKILWENYNQTKNPRLAVAYYHSRTPARATAYLQRFDRHYKNALLLRDSSINANAAN